MHDHELGGTLVPTTTASGECVLKCEIHKLVQGTAMKSGTEESRRYSLDGRDDEVLLATTPFFTEVFRVFPVCGWNERCNIYFHTHPVMILDTDRASLIPPSIGDMVAHCVMGNLRNWKQNRILNTTFVAAFEGIYVYNITAAGFGKMRKWIASIEQQHPAAVAAQNADDPMDLADPVYEHVMSTLSERLKGPYAEFSEQMERFCEERRDQFSLEGAEKLGDSRWRCKRSACHPDYNFPYARALATDAAFKTQIAGLLRHNAYSTALRTMGFYFDWYPWHEDHTRTMEIPVNTTAARVNNK